MDTFYAPVVKDCKSTRRKATDMVALSYSPANNVLVLDPELQKVTHSSYAPKQGLALVLSFSWTSEW